MSGEQVLDKAKQTWLYWHMIVLYFALFTINSLGTCIIAALVGTNWATLDTQGKWMIVIAVATNWTGTTMAFVNKAMSRVQEGKAPLETGNTQQFVKEQ